MTAQVGAFTDGDGTVATVLAVHPGADGRCDEASPAQGAACLVWWEAQDGGLHVTGSDGTTHPVSSAPTASGQTRTSVTGSEESAGRSRLEG